ncbi:MAG: ABC transporter permease [Candidatus Dojkabacteria bacterium]
MSKTQIVIKREYFKVVKKATFWASTLLFPILIVVVSLISGFSAQQAEETGKRIAESEKGSQIAIFDEANLINRSLFLTPEGTSSARFIINKEEGIKDVKTGTNPAFIYYPKDAVSGSKIEIYVSDKGLFGNTRYDAQATEWIKASILTSLPADLQAAYNSKYSTQTKAYGTDGQEVDTSAAKLVLPIASIAIYMILTSFATSYLLMSVSEEKESRVMEIVLSNMKPRELITGKILGQIGVVITQVLILGSLSGIALLIFKNNINIGFDLSTVSFTFGQLLVAIFYTILSFFILACVMVGVGAAMPSYKEAQSFSSIFIVISVIPFYFVTLLLADPSGTIAQILSYFPLTSGLVLLFRNALGVLTPIEIIVSSIVLLVYAYIALYLAFKLFEFGSLEYGRKISWKDFFRSIRA